MTKEEVHYGDIIHSNDDTLVKVHHIGNNGEVHYLAYADNTRGKMGEEPYKSFYGNILHSYPATKEQKLWLERWIIEHTK